MLKYTKATRDIFFAKQLKIDATTQHALYGLSLESWLKFNFVNKFLSKFYKYFLLFSYNCYLIIVLVLYLFSTSSHRAKYYIGADFF